MEAPRPSPDARLIGAPALQNVGAALSAAAQRAIQGRAFATARPLLGALINLGLARLEQLPMQAICLGVAGEHEEAFRLFERSRRLVDALPPESERRSVLERLHAEALHWLPGGKFFTGRLRAASTAEGLSHLNWR